MLMPFAARPYGRFAMIEGRNRNGSRHFVQAGELEQGELVQPRRGDRPARGVPAFLIPGRGTEVGCPRRAQAVNANPAAVQVRR